MPTPDKTGGPAFPVVENDQFFGCRVTSGMTLRDYFAARCLPTLIALSAEGRLEDEDIPDGLAKDIVASQAYAIADAMISFREKLNSPQEGHPSP